MKICSRCIYDETVDNISFGIDGVCNYCHQIDFLIDEYGVGKKKGEQKFDQLVNDIKKAGKGKKYDCIVGVSGGTDSSYMLWLAKTKGLRPLAVHYDNTWNSAIATQNIRKMLSALDIDLYTYVVDNKESEDICRAFFTSGVPELEAANDLALAEVMYRAAWKFKVSYVLEGHSFVTEGITPVGRNYFDGKYIATIHKRFGRLPMKSYPLMTFSRFLWWILAAKIQKIRPFWYIHYNKEEARSFLEKEFGWEYYGGHHLENRMTSFSHSVFYPQRFNADFRNNTISSQVRNGNISREEGLSIYRTPIEPNQELVNYFCKRLEISQSDYDKLMNAPRRSWTDFPTYKKRFERMRPLFKILADRNLVPRSFYLKYCFPVSTR